MSLHAMQNSVVEKVRAPGSFATPIKLFTGFCITPIDLRIHRKFVNTFFALRLARFRAKNSAVRTILAAANLIPPCLCRLVARQNHGSRGITHAELARRSGLSKSKVMDLSFRTSWDGVSIDVLQRFALACGVNHMQTRRTLEYLRRRKMMHVRQAPPASRRFYARLFELVKH